MNIEDLIGIEFEGNLSNRDTTLMFLVYQSFNYASLHTFVGFMEDLYGIFPISGMVSGDKIRFRKHEDRIGFLTNVYKDYRGKIERTVDGWYVIKGDFVLSKDPNFSFEFEMKEKQE